VSIKEAAMHKGLQRFRFSEPDIAPARPDGGFTTR
jgi:hypothetical protein